LVTINRIVTDREEKEIDFFLTESPFCSSALEPDMTALSAWPFQKLFTVERKVRLKAVQLMDALREAGIDRIDWLKIDTQGTDLRIFRSLPKTIQDNVLVAEFEPGILDAYKGEDKLFDVMNYMHDGFFMSAMEVKGVGRLSPGISTAFSSMKQRALRAAHRTAPGWAEVTFMNLLNSGNRDVRSYQLLFVFALVEGQFGFAAEVAAKGLDQTGEGIFEEMRTFALKQVSGLSFRWPFFAVRNRLNRTFDSVFN
jgi:FkbM family methyltransferase